MSSAGIKLQSRLICCSVCHSSSLPCFPVSQNCSIKAVYSIFYLLNSHWRLEEYTDPFWLLPFSLQSPWPCLQFPVWEGKQCALLFWQVRCDSRCATGLWVHCANALLSTNKSWAARAGNYGDIHPIQMAIKPSETWYYGLAGCRAGARKSVMMIASTQGAETSPLLRSGEGLKAQTEAITTLPGVWSLGFLWRKYIWNIKFEMASSKN